MVNYGTLPDVHTCANCRGEAKYRYIAGGHCSRSASRIIYRDQREIDYLHRHEQAIRRIMEAVEMPDRLAENLVMFIRQNHGALPKRRREGEFKQLRDDEVVLIEGVVNEAFEGFEGGPDFPAANQQQDQE